MKKKKLLVIIAIVIILAIAVLIVILCRRPGAILDEWDEFTEAPQVELLYGIDFSGHDIETGEVASGQSLSTLLNPYGVSGARIEQAAGAAEPVFNIRNIRAGNKYTVFLRNDSTARLDYFIYEQNPTDFVVFDFRGDSIEVRKEKKDIDVVRRYGEGTIQSSLWNAMVGSGYPPGLSMELSDIYAWTIDFFGLQEGDSFRLIYDEHYIDSVSVGTGRIWGAIFTHAGKEYYAIPFPQNEKISYWDQEGNSLRKNFLKAPLQFSRISSKFSNSRLHPVLKIRRPHHGVDYAAPAGTPVHAVADGVVTQKSWDSKGGGNMLKIKHNSELTSGYLHLKGYASGIVVGKRVSQGDLIGYVGSTGIATGPHLDFRIWRNGTPIDPLSIPSEPAEPVSDGNREAFNYVRDRILAELRGDSIEVISSFDSLPGMSPLISPDSLSVVPDIGDIPLP